MKCSASEKLKIIHWSNPHDMRRRPGGLRRQGLWSRGKHCIVRCRIDACDFAADVDRVCIAHEIANAWVRLVLGAEQVPGSQCGGEESF